MQCKDAVRKPYRVFSKQVLLLLFFSSSSSSSSSFDVGPTRKLSPIKTKVLSDAGEIRTGWATTKDICGKDGLTWTITLVVGLTVHSSCVNSTLAV